MATITPGNRLYLYQLLSRELGTGKQTMLARVDDVLAADGMAPADLACADTQEILEELDFVKLTVFKGGRVYATVLPDAAADQLLATVDKPSMGDKGRGKPWKRRGAKMVRPTKPRHFVEGTNDVSSGVGVDAQAPVEERATKPIDVQGEPEGQPAGDVAPESKVLAAEPAALVASTPTPSINLTITYNPYEGMEGEYQRASAETETVSVPVVESVLAHKIQSDLPQHFSEDVMVKDGPLSVLYQSLPLDVDPMAVLDEDWRVSRSTGTFEGTRSNVTFPLRYLREDGLAPITITLRRSAKAVAGKYWTIEQVNIGIKPTERLDAPGIGGAEKRDEGAWTGLSALANTHPVAASPVREFTQFALIGTWAELLSELAATAVPEHWDYPGKTNRAILREYVVVTFHRLVREGKLAVATDGSLAAFDTGLITPSGDDVYACLTPRTGDIPWELAGFCAAGRGELGIRLEKAFDELPLPACYLGDVPVPPFAHCDHVTVSPSVWRQFSQPLERHVTGVLRRAEKGLGIVAPAYDPADEGIKLLLPLDATHALVVAQRDDGYEAVATMPLEKARTCARMVSAAIPSWLG